MRSSTINPERVRRSLAYLLLLGLFLTFRGYRSREVDQAYRLPILLHGQDARLYADDPFVRSFDQFNPHRGYLWLLDAASRPLGLSAALAIVFVLTFWGAVAGIDRLGTAVWGDQGGKTGLVAAALVVMAQAGNIGTNHLFEPILLDRLIAFGLGWLALAVAVEDPDRGRWLSAALIGLAALIHPSLGLQLAIFVSVARLVWLALDHHGVRECVKAAGAVGLLALAVVPGLALNLSGSRLLLDGLGPEDVRLLCAEIQSPQHMLPGLWRRPQWLAWGCYPVLALISLRSDPCDSLASHARPARARLVVLLIVNLAGLAVAWVGIEWLRDLRLTLFQPFRMATVARGLCLVLVARRVQRLWEGGGGLGRLRAVLLVVALMGDWMLVAATAFEATMTILDGIGPRLTGWPGVRFAGLAVLAGGWVFLSRHDTESGHLPMIAAALAVLVAGRIGAGGSRPWSGGRMGFRLAAAWTIPIAAIGANLVPDGAWTIGRPIREALLRRCRFVAAPLDDMERLAVWCRDHTPEAARFIGPPGPKTFRLWSLRSLAFNRAASPYHAAGLADWSRRFRDHVAFEGTNAAFARAYLRDRHGLERRYDALSPVEKAALAGRQRADFVVALAPRGGTNGSGAVGPLALLHVEGRYAVYKVNRPARVVDRRPGASGPERRR